MDDYYRPRSRSQSRYQQQDDGFAPLSAAQRSKSLDTRRDVDRDVGGGVGGGGDPFYDPPAGFRNAFHSSIPKRSYERRFGGGGDGRGDGRGDEFFNETITIPRSKVTTSGLVFLVFFV